MIFAQMIACSALVGFVAMGFVWYGWGLVENVAAVRASYTVKRARATAKAAEEEVVNPEE